MDVKAVKTSKSWENVDRLLECTLQLLEEILWMLKLQKLVDYGRM